MNSSDGSHVAALYVAATVGLNIKAPELRQLVDVFGSLGQVLSAPTLPVDALSDQALKAAAKLRSRVAKHEARAARQVDEALSAGLGVVTWEQESYPPPLHHDPVGCAPVLFIEGSLPPQLNFGSHAVRSCAVVGTRKASLGGRSFTKDLGRTLAREGIVVVSGLAIGIDGAAHEGAVEALEAGRFSTPSSVSAPYVSTRMHVAHRAPQGYEWASDVVATPRPAPTVAVLGGGHKHLHPAAHRGLARRILATGGAVISEWPPDTSPQKYTFLQRNRVISGLARVVAVVEAGPRSGTNSTVKHALDQGRTVMAVPAAPWNLSGATCLELIRNGAPVLLDADRVFEEYPELKRRLPQQVLAEQQHIGFERASNSNFAGSDEEGSAALQTAMHGGQRVALDKLVQATGLAPGQTMALLAQLELEGLVEATSDGRYRWRR